MFTFGTLSTTVNQNAMTRQNDESVILDKRLMNYQLINYSYNKIMDWGQILSGSAVGGVLVELIRYMRDRFKQKSLASDSLIKLNEIYSKCMKLVLDETPADRFIVFKAENGGGKIVPGVQLFASVLYEDYRQGSFNNKAILDKYQRWLCDKHYVEMLSQLCIKGSIKFNSSVLDDESRFKNVCIAENMYYCEMHFIAQRSDKFFFCLIASSEKEENFSSARTRNNIDIGVDRLRNIFKESVKNL